MKLIILALLSLLTFSVQAESYLCISEEAAGVRSKGGSVIKATIVDASDLKFILTDGSGKLELKFFGTDQAFLDKCSSIHFCENSDGYKGTFLYETSGLFTINYIAIVGKERIAVVSQGLCSKI